MGTWLCVSGAASVIAWNCLIMEFVENCKWVLLLCSTSPQATFSFIFNWRIIGLQYCAGFCHTSTRISHRYKHVLSLSSLPATSHSIPPLEVVTEHWFDALNHWISFYLSQTLDFPGVAVVRICLPMQEMQETGVWSLGWEDPLEEEMATHSSILAW